MFNPFDTPGLRYICEYSHPRVNHGQLVPLFEPVAPEGRPSINTLEGWTAAADRVNHKSFISANGREPRNREELYAWVDRICKKAEAAV